MYTKTKFGLLPIAVNEKRTVKPIGNDLIRFLKGIRKRDNFFIVRDCKKEASLVLQERIQ
jgi:hypothetical protein